MNKVKTSITIDPYILEEAKKNNINISSLTENKLRQAINPKEPLIEFKDKNYPFEFCEDRIPEHLKNMLWGCVAIRATKCSKCDRIFFVNDAYDKMEPFICKKCF